ncbi:MAG: hypothetical protein HC834_06675, partial [Rhodospirillales bacterium]|nr:hypothetical protein [Rhodospirillales bacterium]
MRAWRAWGGWVFLLGVLSVWGWPGGAAGMRKTCIQVNAPVEILEPTTGARVGNASAYQICQDESGNFTVEAVGDIRWYVATNGTIGVRQATGEEIDLWRRGGIPAENSQSDPLQWDGAFVERYRDYEAPGFSPGLGYRFERVYNSRRSAVRSVIGFGWSLHYDQYVLAGEGGCENPITVVLDGSPIVFVQEAGEPSRSWWPGADPSITVVGYRNAQSPTYRLERVQDPADRPGDRPRQQWEYWLVDVETGTRSVFRSHREHLPERSRPGETRIERIRARDFVSHPVLFRIEDAAGNALRFTWEVVPIVGYYRILGVRLASVEDTRQVTFR